ncbi:UbiA family prenyltransferase [Amycolatopsis sp. WQ 127309]|uniref:UbiA family prenyltransferase n=1 Tax=Amycolatopsis sp. WQ 127309 TaxID=2932773 RepID=UPI001FF6A280|nr:UbiA family prenyltransferase [Amycolatopsis sp. WQ 127309]UOZ07012.1 UbiA family prenyltransferase [Amycolatopsis sp. WQ 127309]
MSGLLLGSPTHRPFPAVRSRLFAHFQTWRPYTVWYPGLIAVAGGATAARSDVSAGPIVLAWASATAAWLGAHYLGDYLDRDLDAIAKPQRPIPSGRLAAREALSCGALLLIAGVVFAGLAAPAAGVLAVAICAGIWSYSALFKSRGILGNLVRGLLSALACALGATAVTGGLSFPAAVLGLAAAFCLHDTASNLVGAMRDVVGDSTGGYGTVPVRHGLEVATGTAAVLYTAGAALVVTVGWTAGGDPGYWVLGGIALSLGFVALSGLRGIANRSARKTALRSHAVLVVARLAFAAAPCTLGFPTSAVLAVALVLVLATVVTQHLMRQRHETPARSDSEDRL